MEAKRLYTRPRYHLWRGDRAWCGRLMSGTEAWLISVGAWLECPADQRCPGCVLAHSRAQMLLYSPAELAEAQAAHLKDTRGAEWDVG